MGPELATLSEYLRFMDNTTSDNILRDGSKSTEDMLFMLWELQWYRANYRGGFDV